ncbi:MAG: cobalamin biosynthesis protein [Candidatus Schekmanbacteria bacterium]|nr:cobalamin biosynthesis protein [Candidatus Schekmanbacteria bacterium]
MPTAVLALNPYSQAVAQKIKNYLGDEAVLFAPPEEKLSDWLVSRWGDFNAWVFVLPLGVVIRIIAPLIKSKYRDPAVVTVDEGGRYFISTLSGHEGGANLLAQRLATALCAEAVITTATEARKDLVIGLGCRRGVTCQQVLETIQEGLKLAGRDLNQVRLLASIDIKHDETGLLEAARNLGLPINFIPQAWLKDADLDYERSALVEKHLGIGGVAQPCALLSGKRTKIILPRTIINRMTISIAQENSTW